MYEIDQVQQKVRTPITLIHMLFLWLPLSMQIRKPNLLLLNLEGERILKLGYMSESS
jgi:hypothetical protein